MNGSGLQYLEEELFEGGNIDGIFEDTDLSITIAINDHETTA